MKRWIHANTNSASVMNELFTDVMNYISLLELQANSYPRPKVTKDNQHIIIYITFRNNAGYNAVPDEYRKDEQVLRGYSNFVTAVNQGWAAPDDALGNNPSTNNAIPNIRSNLIRIIEEQFPEFKVDYELGGWGDTEFTIKLILTFRKNTL